MTDTVDPRVRSEIRDVIHELENSNTQLTYPSYVEVRDKYGLSGYEREALYPYMSNECLGTYIEQHVLPYSDVHSRCFRMPATTYDTLLVNILIPLIIERLKNDGDNV